MRIRQTEEAKMIVSKRNEEVLIEDGMNRVVVYEDGSGYLHENRNVHEVELHQPVYLMAAQQAGLAITNSTIEASRRMLDEMHES